MKKNSLHYLTSADLVTIVFVLFITSLEALFAQFAAANQRISTWYIVILLNVALVGFILFSTQHVYRYKNESNTLLRLARDWYLVPTILFMYTQTSSIVHPIRQIDFDQTLIAIDRMIFGVDPTIWISQFAHPIITEILQIAYSSYYLFFIALFYELYRRKDRSAFYSGGMLVVYGFYLSYIGYLLVPAVGPRFTIHEFFSVDSELPGLFLTPYLRAIIDSGGGVPSGAMNPLEFVHRDVFPSGHTQLTLVAMYVAFTNHTKSRWWLLVVGSLLIISTVYMRYHYVIDVVAGILFFFFTIWSGKRIDRWWREGIKNV